MPDEGPGRVCRQLAEKKLEWKLRLHPIWSGCCSRCSRSLLHGCFVPRTNLASGTLLSVCKGAICSVTASDLSGDHHDIIAKICNECFTNVFPKITDCNKGDYLNCRSHE